MTNDIHFKKCNNCEKPFQCDSAKGSCWCFKYPPFFKPNATAGCFCPDCLKKATMAQIAQYVATLTPQTALNNIAKELPKTPDELDIDYYFENNYKVFTAWSHLKRGSCCQNKCRHCPYGF